MRIRSQVISVMFLAALAQITVSAAPQASAFLSSSEVQEAERAAKTTGDHQKLATHYQSEAQKLQAKLASDEDTLRQWASQAWMVGRTKTPNPYSVVQLEANQYRSKLEKLTQLVAVHQKLADSLR